MRFFLTNYQMVLFKSILCTTVHDLVEIPLRSHIERMNL